MVTRDQVEYAKPDPDLFLTAAKRLNVPIEKSVVVGDSVWDLLAARRAHALGVGLLSGVMGRTNWNGRVLIAFTTTPLTCFVIIDELGVRNADLSSLGSIAAVSLAKISSAPKVA